MATRTYVAPSEYGTRPLESAAPTRTAYGAGVQVFLWIGWAAIFAFWAFTMTTFFGILRAVGEAGPTGLQGGIDAGGAGWFLMDVAGVVILGLALAWGMARWSMRDRRLDPVTEASTAALYDMVEAAGGDDEISRSPEARALMERDSYRPG